MCGGGGMICAYSERMLSATGLDNNAFPVPVRGDTDKKILLGTCMFGQVHFFVKKKKKKNSSI